MDLGSSSSSKKERGPNAADYAAAYHCRWEVDLHVRRRDYERKHGQQPKDQIDLQYLEDTCNALSYTQRMEVVECPPCTEQLRGKLSRGEAPWGIPPEVEKQLREIGIRVRCSTATVRTVLGDV